MKEAYSLALKKAYQSQTRSPNNYNRHLNYMELKAGDRVLVRNLTPRGGTRGKLRSYWENDVYVVVNRKGDGPVYEVRREDGEGNNCVLHRNILFPCEFLQLATQRSQAHPRRQRRIATRRQRSQLTKHTSHSSCSTASESDWEYQPLPPEVLQREERPEVSDLNNSIDQAAETTLANDVSNEEPEVAEAACQEQVNVAFGAVVSAGTANRRPRTARNLEHRMPRMGNQRCLKQRS